MQWFVELVQEYAASAHWFVFAGALLAGFSLPISIDLLMVISASLAATVIPEHTLHLFFTMFFGCLFSAWIAYGIGRKWGPQLFRFRFFANLLNEERREKVRSFYERHGLFTLILGRFIPFGVRNCIFMSSGLTRVPFLHFALRDILACGIWTLACFTLFYLLGKNIQLIFEQVKAIHLYLFLAVKVALIGFIWYKRKKRTPLKN